MNVRLILTTGDNAQVLKNLWPLYLHDLSEFTGAAPNRHGVLLEDESVSTLNGMGNTLSDWWRKPEWLFPYLIESDGHPAGFCLIGAGPYVPAGVEVDFLIYEFFVLHAFRGKGVAKKAALSSLQKHRGSWEIVTYPEHQRAISFWNGVVKSYTKGAFSQEEIDHPWGRKVTFRFKS